MVSGFRPARSSWSAATAQTEVIMDAAMAWRSPAIPGGVLASRRPPGMAARSTEPISQARSRPVTEKATAIAPRAATVDRPRWRPFQRAKFKPGRALALVRWAPVMTAASAKRAVISARMCQNFLCIPVQDYRISVMILVLQENSCHATCNGIWHNLWYDTDDGQSSRACPAKTAPRPARFARRQ